MVSALNRIRRSVEDMAHTLRRIESREIDVGSAYLTISVRTACAACGMARA
jgi:hypothetical protein